MSVMFASATNGTCFVCAEVGCPQSILMIPCQWEGIVGACNKFHNSGKEGQRWVLWPS